jgi:hypothetical protein
VRRIDDAAIVAYISIRRNIFHTAHIMQIINLTHEEAADPAVIRSLLTLMQGEHTTVMKGIGLDAPNIGAAIAAVVPQPDTVAAAHFGEAPMPAAVVPAAVVPAAVVPAAVVPAAVVPVEAPALPQPVPTPAPSTVGVVPLSIVPVVPVATLPASPPPPVAPPSVPVPASWDGAPTEHATHMSPAGVEVDARGLPWDQRIHAGTKRKNADGTWTARRGLNDPALLARVEAELRQTMGAGAAPAPVPVPAAVVPVPAAVVPPPAPPEAPAVATGETFAQFCTRLSPHLASGAVTQAQLLQAATELGLPGFPSLMQRPDLLPQFATKVGL